MSRRRPRHNPDGGGPGDSRGPGNARPGPRRERPARSAPDAPPTAAKAVDPGGETGGKAAGDPARQARLFGWHAVRAAWLNPARRCRQLWLSEAAAADFEAVLAEAEQAGLPRPAPERVDRRRLERLLPEGAVHQGLALEAEPLPDPGIDGVLHRLGPDAPCRVLLLDQVTDPHNVGAILRSAAAFGAAALVMTERHAPPVTGTLARAASGALEAVPVCRVVNLARTLRQLAAADFLCLGLAEDAPRALPAIDPPPRIALVVGAEGAGLRRLTRETCHVLARLPTVGSFSTLNASNAAAVALYALTAGAGTGTGAGTSSRA